MSNNLEFPSSIAFITPRFAKSIGGGAETLSRELALAIVEQYPETQVEVWTTCALDHRTWENEAPEGVSDDEGIKVSKFPVNERDLEVFISSEHRIQGGDPFPVDSQLAWLEASVNSEQLYAHIQENGPKFDVLVFAPYLFATSFWGSLIYPERSVVIPCLHDEPYAYLDVFKVQLSKVRGLVCNAAPERDLVHDICGEILPKEKTAVVGMGFVSEGDKSTKLASGETLKINSHIIDKPYLLYSGRKELGKNVDFLIDCFEAIEEGLCQLVMIGAGSIDFRDELPAGVLDLGFVSEDEKKQLMANCIALCQPSLNESFSIVMMEAWQQETPCLVHGASAVTRHHVSSSSGGLYFENAAEFSAVVNYLLENPLLAQQMGTNGKHYVETEYCWQAVLKRFSLALAQFGFIEQDSHSNQLQTACE